MAQQKVVIAIPEDLDPGERQDLGLDIIEFIKDRTRDGVGFRKSTGRNYNLSRIKYTKEYAKKKGVSRSDVDLTLTEQMLESMALLNSRAGSLTIGYVAGTKENAKAEGNQKGSYGGRPNSSKARPFLGLTKKDLSRIMANNDG